MKSLFHKKLRAMTLIEIIVAMAILVIVMAAMMPLLRSIQNSWAYKQGSSEILQNGRILMDHLTANLSQAARVTTVSASDIDNGFIEYLDNDGNTIRYDINATGCVEFGPVGSLYELAGPATKLRFTCYDVNNLDLAITDPNRIRVVGIDALLPDTQNPLLTKSFTTKVFLRANTLAQQGNIGTKLLFDATTGKLPALCSIDAAHHLCAYEAAGANGYAVVLGTDADAAAITFLSSYEFDAVSGQTPALAKIDTTHYLCVYEGSNNGGWAVILQVNPSTWAISKGAPFAFDVSGGQRPALAQIDASHYLCAYQGHEDRGNAVILTVNVATGAITKGTAFEYDNSTGIAPAMARIDAAHYLCVYKGAGNNGSSVILVPDTTTGTISKAASFDFDSASCEYPALTQIDPTHYLCTYASHSGNNSSAIILTVSLSPPAIGKSASYQFSTQKDAASALARIDGGRYICTYQENDGSGEASILAVDTIAGKISSESTFIIDNNGCASSSLSAVDGTQFLCTYEGLSGKGYAVMLSTVLHVFP